MAIFADVAGRSKMNSLRMARPSRHESVHIRKLKDTIKKNKRDLFAEREKNISAPPRTRGKYTHEDFRLSQYDRTATQMGLSFADKPISLAQKFKELEARRQANIVSNRGAGEIVGQTMQQFGENYINRMVAFNALPQTVTSLTNAPLQAMVNYGSPGLQKLILQTLGPKLGAGAARLADTMLAGGTATIPALNFGSGLLFVDPPPGAGNIPENRLQQFSNFFGVQQALEQSPVQPGWNIGK